jgi:hypothetical protein
MAVIRDKNTGEPIAWTADDPIAKREGPSPQPYPGEAGSTLMRSSDLTAGKNLDQAEMAMNGSREQVDARPSQKWTDEYGTVWSSKPPDADLKTIQDDMGNTITYDPNNPNPESTSAYSTNNYGNDAPVSPDQQYQDNQDAAAASDAGNMGSNSNVSPGMNEDTLGTSPTTTSYTSTVTEEGNSDNLGTTPTDIGTGQVVDNAVDNSGDLSFGGSALTNNSDLNSSVGSSLGGVTDKGEMFSSSTEAQSKGASDELSSSLGSLSSVDLQGAMKALGGSIGVAAGVLAKAGAIGALANSLSKGMGLSAIQGLTKAVQLAALGNIAKNLIGQVSHALTSPSKIGDAQAHAKMLANQAAANTGLPTVTSVNGTNVTVQPPARPNDIINLAKGTPLATVPPDGRSIANYEKFVQSQFGYTSAGGDDTGGPPPPGLAKSITSIGSGIVGTVRTASAVIPSMEAVMFDVPAAALSKFTSLLPPTFKSLLPIGAIAGMAVKGPLSLGGLTQLVGGAALGAVAGQALRSVGAGTQGLGAVSGMTGLLGAQALARTVGTGSIPVNIASTYGNAMLSRSVGSVAGNLSSNILGTNPSTTAMIANVVGVVSNVALNKNIAGIPVSSQVLGLAANVALRSAGVSVGLPTSVLGTAASFANNPLSSLVGALVGGRVPIIPTNLSLGNVGALSGITQNLQGVGLAENIIPRSQITGLLPGNLQNQVRSSVPERMRGKPGYMNEVQDKNASATTKPSEEETKPRVADSGPAKPAIIDSVGPDDSLNYNAKVSKYFTLGDMTIKIGGHAQIGRPIQHSGSPFTTKQHVEGLSWLAQNLMDVLWDNVGPILVISGFRGPNGNNPQGDHGRGAAHDITLKKEMGRSGALKLGLALTQLGLESKCGWCAVESKPSERYSWLHLGGGKDHPTAKDNRWHPVSTWTAAKPYTEGFLMNPR